MAYRNLELNIISATDLKNVNFLSTMKVYAVVSIDGDPYVNQKFKTSDKHRPTGSNPTWNFPVKFAINVPLAEQNRLSLRIKLKSRRFFGDKLVGEVYIPVKDLLDNSDGESMKLQTFQVTTRSGKPEGKLSLSYKFGSVVPEAEVRMAKNSNEPVLAYPAGGAGSSYSQYPQQGYGYPPPMQQQQQQQQAYPYPQPGYGYGYPGQMQQPRKNSRFGMGMGTGLLGGMLGGMLIGDMMSDGFGGGGCGGGGCGGGGCGGGGCGGGF